MRKRRWEETANKIREREWKDEEKGKRNKNQGRGEEKLEGRTARS